MCLSTANPVSTIRIGMRGYSQYLRGSCIVFPYHTDLQIPNSTSH